MAAVKVLVFSERLAPPFDEGIKNVSINLFRELRNAGHSVHALTVGGAASPELPLASLAGVNRTLLSRDLSQIVRALQPDRVCYVPSASMTAGAFLRSRILGVYAQGAPLTMLALQPRRMSRWGKMISSLCAPDLLLVFSSSTAARLAHLGKRVSRVSVGVDPVRFAPLEPSRRTRLREELGIPIDRKVVLHVGHLHRARNLEPLKAIQNLEGVQVLLVTSSVKQDANLSDGLLRSGIQLLQGRTLAIELVYGLSDLYVFTCPIAASPDRSAAIDLPLSVFEAMACNLPVVTTRFGGLCDLFTEAPDFRYVDDPFDPAEWQRKVGNALREDAGANRQKVLPYPWSRLTDAVLGSPDE